MTSHRYVSAPHPQDSSTVAIADFYLFVRLKRQLLQSTLDSEENLLETVTEIRSELPNDKVKSSFVHLKEKCQWVADHNGDFWPNWLNVKLL
jgi:hypothetical protein